MIYNIYVQDKLTLTIEATNTSEVLKQIGAGLTNHSIVFDPSIPTSIKIEPVQP